VKVKEGEGYSHVFFLFCLFFLGGVVLKRYKNVKLIGNEMFLLDFKMEIVGWLLTVLTM